MNTGVIIIAVLLAAGAALTMVMAAASQPQGYTDTYGNAMPAATNHTQDMIGKTTGPMLALEGGAVLFIAFLFVAAAVIYLWHASQGHGSRGRQG